jgi:serine/threonine protein kinase
MKLHRVYESADKIYLITEFINGSELISFPSSKITFTANDLKGFIYNMLLALNELQNHNIMHRDIKPQNIMLRDNKL